MAAVTRAEIAAAPNGKKWHDLYPELGTGPVPIEPYISEEYYGHKVFEEHVDFYRER
jgi:hypothetical protein